MSACDIYVKDTLRASMPPVLSTVSEESTTPCVSDKSAKMAVGRCLQHIKRTYTIHSGINVN